MGKLSCGFSQVDITPEPQTVYLDGYGGRFKPAEGVRDPLFAKICAVRSGDQTFVIAVLDICGPNREVTERLRSYIRLFTGLEDAQFALCATHTHAGPGCGLLIDLPINWLYWNHVGLLVAQAIQNALSAACEGEFRFAYGDELTRSYNRRGQEIIDRRVPVCAFFNAENRLCGVITSASCHAVCSTDYHISADYPGVMTQQAAVRYPGVPFLFLQGRGADVDPQQKDVDWMGEEFAACVFSAMDRLDHGVSEGEMRSLFRTIRVPMSYPDRDTLCAELMEAKQILLAAETDRDRRIAAVQVDWRLMALKFVEAGADPALNSNVQLMTIGKCMAFAFISFEMLTATGNAIEKILTQYGIARNNCFVIGYTNGVNGYLAPAAEGGTKSYETQGAARWIGLPVCTADSEPAVLNAMAEMAKTLLSE